MATVTPKQLDEALKAAQAACIAYTQPVEVRPGQKLCAAGRVMRAMDIANKQPATMRARLEAEIKKLSAEADARLEAWRAAERHYVELCRQAGTEPSTTLAGDPCGCEGCQLVIEGIEAVKRATPLPEELWSRHKSMDAAQIAYGKVAGTYDTVIAVDREQGLYIVCAGDKARAEAKQRMAA